MDGADADVSSADASALGESLLSGDNSYVVHGQDGDESLREGNAEDVEPFREQDRFLPIANVARIMKKSVPKSGKIAKDAKECCQECVSEFISFITSEASERCHQEKRKTINGEDILFAMSTLGFDNYVEPLKLYLQKYRESNKGDKTLNSSSIAEGGDALSYETAVLHTDETLPQGILTTNVPAILTSNVSADQVTGHPNVVYTTTSYPTQVQMNTINFS